ncbi:MAG: alpha/beta hydrolase [Acidimicrobiales bacterium]
MTAVLVHGVPETAGVWGPMTDHLAGDIVTLSLPGFGTPLPEGFEPTKEAYAQWLAGELASMGEPVHLVAHDWGALLSLRVLAGRPGNIASWVLDFGDIDAGFAWHDLAQLWISPGGEEFMDGLLAMSVEDRAAMLAAAGIPESGALDMAAGIDDTMAAAILSLYRSAVDVGAEWGPGIDEVTGRGMIIQATNDTYGSPARIARLAERTGARVAPMEGSGHWWMLDDPAGAAALITDFWGFNQSDVWDT